MFLKSMCIRRVPIWRCLVVIVLLSVVLIAVDLSFRAASFTNTRRHLEMNGWEIHTLTEIPAGSFASVEYSLPLCYSTGFGLFGATEATFHQLAAVSRPVAFDVEDAVLACALPGLKMLRLTCQGRILPARLCEAISDAPNLEYLQLDDCRFTPKCLSVILGNNSVHILSLSNCPLADSDLSAISASSNLREIRLLRVGIDQGGINKLRDGLPRCTVTFMGN